MFIDQIFGLDAYAIFENDSGGVRLAKLKFGPFKDWATAKKFADDNGLDVRDSWKEPQ